MSKLYVTAAHINPTYQFANQAFQIIAVGEDGIDGPYVRSVDGTAFYAVADALGIGRDCSSAIEAIESLLEYNGCSAIRVTRAPHKTFAPVSSTKAIEAAFADVIAEHGLATISIGYSDRGGGNGYYSAALHWDGYARSNNSCVSEHSDESVAHALRKAITAMRADRMTGLLSVAVPVFEMGEVA